jgi:hypothetical protein
MHPLLWPWCGSKCAAACGKLYRFDVCGSGHCHITVTPCPCFAVLQCSWSRAWGLNGSFRIAYGAAYVMQPDYTFAVQYNKADLKVRGRDIRRKMQSALSNSTSTPVCLLYSPKQPQRLLKLADDLTTYAMASASTTNRLRKADILADLVASNLGHLRSLSAAGKGPFRLCGKTMQLLKDLVPLPWTSPQPRPVPPQSPAPSKPDVYRCTCAADVKHAYPRFVLHSTIYGVLDPVLCCQKLMALPFALHHA